MESIFTHLQTTDVHIHDGIVLVEGKPLGVLCPSSLEGFGNARNERMISGPKGLKKVDLDNAVDIVQALVATGSILFGSAEDIDACKKLLLAPETSRTASYLCAIAENCGAVCQAMENMHNARVLIVGCGGIGALSAFNFAGAGVKHIKLIDDDTIEQSNMNRQFFWRSEDIGQKKVAVLRRELQRRYHDLSIDVLDHKITDDSICAAAQGYDLVLLTADEPLGIGDARLKQLASTGAIRMITCGYFHANLSVTYVCGQSSETWEGDYTWNRNPWFIGPSFGPSNTEIAGFAASLCLHALCFPESKNFNSPFVSHWSTDNFPRSATTYPRGVSQ
ncbi:hypothetical protein HDN1F_12330 [gamma proteobacterium HdN1]|nr:hypothetical protein HDN1F_12330 [gamma proteobacterium HdN1]